MAAPQVNMQAKRKSPIGYKEVLFALFLSLCATHVALADDWSLKDKDGVHYRLSEQKGKWVLVNFWAPWCEPCLQEMPSLDALQKLHKDLLVIGVAVLYRKNQEVMDAVRSTSVSYPIVLGNEDIASDFGEMKGMPTSFLYSPSGKLVGHHDGPLTQADIEQVMARQPASAELFAR
ncbi:thiol-disulfide oxidoreductase ResA [mine drainage metagenome]|uniref:Thiol-disulfide oxidoreductase ResA n=1 Tax=mine drainage metagenome TaxID=410659 RepID=A0A1J5RZ34_9ZZZZ